jgi:uncharacterized protein (TIGR02453 family)
MAFRGWPAEAVQFFEELEADNSKPWWEAHKDVYQQAVRAPMEALLAELEPEFGPGRIFRPYRDVRFSADKSPYKTNIAALVGPAGYVALSAEELRAGGGMVHLAPDQLDRYRGAVIDDVAGPALQAAVDEIRAAGHEAEPYEALKTAPRGYPKDHPRVELLRAKGLVMWHAWPVGGWLRTAKAKDRIVDVLRAAVPLTTWLTEHVGASMDSGDP